ncbi:OmpA family protein [Hymenobacter sp. BT491]|uniref:OmpA family protein n=1 Tax=Hymenobacter sp. BT491 TaxID=2766779 RepID=UPI0016535C91|nr:OmpA family protein [Hymenobacter sp. BT491]MBC6990983.1 OmpA family protein [Hymenobacter sp. BT491]
MKKLLFAILALLALPLNSSAQFGLLNAAVDRAANRVAARKIDEAIDRKVAEKTDDYHRALLTEGRLVSYRIQFEPNTATLLPDSYSMLTELTRLLQQQPNLRLSIEAHTLRTGNATASLALAQQRADVVRAALVKNGIAATRLKARGIGEAQPLSTDDSEEMNQLNQRVEFVKL